MRYLVNDPSRIDPRAKLTTKIISEITGETGLTYPKKKYIELTGTKSLKILAGTIISISDAIFKTEIDVILSESDLDVDSFVVGKDYYVYCCDNGTDTESYKISLNTTYPIGYTAEKTRKIGGFHYGDCRKINSSIEPINISGEAWGTGWEDNIFQGILPYSIWTLAHRPKSEPEGMVYCPSINKWVDIYIQSINYKSEYGSVPLTGTEGMSYYDFHEKVARKIRKTPLSYLEFCSVADGSPNGRADSNDYAWSKTTNTARNGCGLIAKAVSVYGLKDCAGNVYEVSKDISWEGSGTFAWRSAANVKKGAIYAALDTDPKILLHGADWRDGSSCGSRSAGCNIYPWNVNTNVGCRFSSDSL